VVDLPREGFADTAVDMNDLHKNAQSSGTSGAIEYRIENTPTEPDAVEVPAQSDVVYVDTQSSNEPTSFAVEPITQANQSQPLDVVEAVPEVPAPTAAEYMVSDESAANLAPFDGDVQALKKRRQELEEEITRQREIMKQLDHMRRAFREVTPQAVLMGLSEAEEKLKAAEQEMESLPIPPEIDPAVIERLQKDLARQIEEKRAMKQRHEEKEARAQAREAEIARSFNPYGRPGAGAPFRDADGNIITNRKAAVEHALANSPTHGRQSQQSSVHPHDYPSFLLLRTLEGALHVSALTLVMSLVADAAGERRGRALGCQGAGLTLGVATGAAIGGLIGLTM
jgi:hypothetical protein